MHDIAALPARREGRFSHCASCGDPVEHLDPARVGRIEIFQPKRDRIGVGRRRKFVHEAFVGEGVLHAARRPDPGRPERRRLEPMADSFDIGELVGNVRVPKMLPGAMVSSAGLPLSVAATSGTTNAFGVCCGMKNSESQAVTVPDASSVARISTSVGGPFGSQPCSSARDHCTRTGRPTALASSAASAAASSCPLRP